MNMKHDGGYTTCPVCNSARFFEFFKMTRMPVNVCVQWPDRDLAVNCPRGDIRLAFCRQCGFVWNLAFDAGLLDYTQAYENSLFFSPLYREYTGALAKRLIRTYNLHDKDLIDIGCGKGDFLFLLCKLGNNRGTGFDTSYEDRGDGGQTPSNVTIVRDFYSDKYAGCKGDFMCSRYVLEHIEYPAAFLKMLRKAIGDRGTTVYFEVPNVSLILRDLSVWDIIYEHCSYFSRESLERIFAMCGFEAIDVYEAYGGQFIGIEACPCAGSGKPAGAGGNGLNEIIARVNDFAENSRRQFDWWGNVLGELERSGKRVAMWGGGAKGVSFLNMLKIDRQIPYVVDINVRKQGRYAAGTGQLIVPPEFLREYRPDALVLTNPIYKEEIRRTVEALDIKPEFLYDKALKEGSK